MTKHNRRHTDHSRTRFWGVMGLLGAIYATALVSCVPAHADNEWTEDVILEAGVGTNMWDSTDVDSSPSYVLRGGYKWFYVGYENSDEVDMTLLGQQVARQEVSTFTFGVRHPVTDQLEVFAEAGIADLDAKYWPSTHEVAYTYLVGRHAVEGRVVPTDGPYDPGYDSVLEYDDSAPVGIVGVAWSPVDHLKVQASYRYLQPDFYVSIKRPNWVENTGYWEEHGQTDMSSFNLHVLIFW